MNKSNPPVLMSGLTISTTDTSPAIDIKGSTMSINSSASIQMGSVVLTEEKMLQFEAALEFIERFTQENQQAKEIWTAIKAKKRILT
jgi:hypothetical protein